MEGPGAGEGLAGLAGGCLVREPGGFYRWLGNDDFAPTVVFLSRVDRSATAEVREMDALVREAWAPINQKYAAVPEPCLEAFLRAYGRHIRGVPMAAQPLTGNGGSALGLDGWGERDLRLLPARLMDWLADLLSMVETLRPPMFCHENCAVPPV